jgi:hypothetical protein
LVVHDADETSQRRRVTRVEGEEEEGARYVT